MTLATMAVALIALGGGQTTATKTAVIQSVLNHPKLQLHYYKSYLSGPKRLEIVCPAVPAGTKVKLFDTVFKTRTTLTNRLKASTFYIFIESVKIKGDQAEVRGQFPAQGVEIEAWPVYQHERWITAREKIGIS